MDYIYVGKEMAVEAQHTNRYEYCQIIHYFINKNYILDICACNDTDIIAYAQKQQYDVIFGLGEVFRKVSPQSTAFKILYLTENPYKISYEREMERIQYFYQRHKIKTNLVRTGAFFQENDEKLADAIICMGDTKYLSHLDVTVKRIWPTAFINAHPIKFDKRRLQNFLVLGTDGFIHKGIDLLIEVFSRHNDWNLYLCGSNIHGTLKKLRYLPVSNNIHDCGYINVMSEQFVELAEKCMYILLPSCSEAPSTAVLTGMVHGLLPIIMLGNGMDNFSEYCLYFDDFHVDSMEKTLCNAVSYSQIKCVEKAIEIMQFAKKEFTIDNFSQNITTIFNELLNNEC